MTLKPAWMLTTLLCGALLAIGASCGDGDDENTGQACTAADGCYKGAKAPLKGTAVCLSRVPGGYCTHTCQTDSDCCAVEGECKSGLPQVCSTFESTGQKLCFLSCEKDVVPSSKDDTAYCQENANRAFMCRSSGGGSQNRKVCVPNG